jgi:ribosomal protein S18
MIKLKNILFEAPDLPPEGGPGGPPISLDQYDVEDPIIQNLEQINIIADRETGETNVTRDDWKYVGSKKRRKRKGSYWRTKDINLRGIGRKVKKFANAYAAWMNQNTNLGPIGPVVTSGYRGPERQINAIWAQWSGDKNYLKPRSEGGVGYARWAGDPIEAIFIEHEDKPNKAKRKAIAFLKTMEKQGKYMSRHQSGKAIDLSLFRGGKYGENNNNVIKFLDYAKDNGLISNYIDERGKAAPHFHIDLN